MAKTVCRSSQGGPSRTWAMIAVLALLLATTGMAAVGTGQQNLLVNPGAEEGQAGWQVPEGQDSWASENESDQEPHDGARYFWPGRIPEATLFQNVDVSAWAGGIDAGGMNLVLTGFMAGIDQGDTATLAVAALDGNGVELPNGYGAKHHRGDNNESNVWTEYRIEMTIPSGTRTLQVRLIATREKGMANDAYFDDLRLAVGGDGGAGGGGGGGDGEALLLVDSKQVYLNETFDVYVRLRNVSDIASANFELFYDPTYLQVIPFSDRFPAEKGTLLTSSAMYDCNLDQPGHIRFGFASSDQISTFGLPGGPVARVKLKAIGKAPLGYTLLTMRPSGAHSGDGTKLQVQTENGRITVADDDSQDSFPRNILDAKHALMISVGREAPGPPDEVYDEAGDGDGQVTAEDARLILIKVLAL